VSQWKKELMDNAGSLFESKRGAKRVNAESGPDRLYAKIRQLNMAAIVRRREIFGDV